MGVVYRAIDTRLDREVAIKALPEELASDAGRLERFEREAKVLASLNHANVAGIHGIEEQELPNGDTAKYLVLEFVEGETLAERLDRGPMDVDDAIEMAVQIAAGVEAAHEAGVIHRDLKPANIKITPEGVAKVLDFGLAKADEGGSSSGSSMSQLPTMTSPAHQGTVEGMILGTAAYMSPEQARGRRVDKRTDIWSFGVVLYEMLVGASPFVGETATDSIGAVLHKDLDFALLPKNTPAGVRRVLSRCVERDKSQRYRDIGDVRVELLRAKNESIDESGGSSKPTPVLLGVLIACVLVVGLIGVVVGRGSSPAAVSVVRHITIESPMGAQIKYSGDNAGPAAVSPDGTMVVFAALEDGKARRLWVRRLGERDSTELVGTDDAMFPFWSPDSKSVGFFTGDLLRRVDLASLTTITVCESGVSRGGTWTTDGRIIFSPHFGAPLMIVDAGGGDSEWLTSFEKDPENPEENLHTTHRWPEMLPDGERFLFLAANAVTSKRQSQSLYLGNLDGSAPKRIMPCDYGAVYRDGWLLFVREGVLLGSRIDLDSAKLTGELRVVAKGVAGDLSTWHGQFSVGGDVLVYNRLSSSRNDTERTQADQAVFGYEGDQVSMFGRDGRVSTRYAEGVPSLSMSLSPDAASLALSVPDREGSQDLWIYPTGRVLGMAAGGDMTDAETTALEQAIIDPDPVRLTFTEGNELYAVWSPDSQEIAFAWYGEGVEKPGIYRKRLGEGGHELLVESGDGEIFPTHWSPDGKYLIYTKGLFNTVEGNDVWAVPINEDGAGEPFPLVQSSDLDDGASVSPDGRWLVYESSGSGSSEVYVIPFAPGWADQVDDAGQGGPPSGTWQVSQSGGWYTKWSADGSELFYATPSGMLMSVGIDTQSDTFRTTGVSELFQTPIDIGSSFSVGNEIPTSRFFFTDMTQAPNASISAILNWQQILEESEGR
ncbi:MAG: Tol biopolymer transport system component/tRNA A-37 threonylcarbamoyl transferase component Bud32 [Phycisphaerales bacterium]|jgi:Tol biopolymer transport system component/tRNA A-37 threonylcarbamoyl transferase component Bud32